VAVTYLNKNCWVFREGGKAVKSQS